MKIKFSTIVAGILTGVLCIVSGCTRVDELDRRVTDLEKKGDVSQINQRLETLEGQVATLNTFKTTIEGLDIANKLSGYGTRLDGVESDLRAVQLQLGDIYTKGEVDNLFGGVNGEISNLKTAIGDFSSTGATSIVELINKRIGEMTTLIDGKVDAVDFDTYKSQTQETFDTFEEILGMLIGELFYIDETGQLGSYIDYLFDYCSQLKFALLETNIEVAGLDDALDSLCTVTSDLGRDVLDLSSQIGALRTDLETNYVTNTVLGEYLDAGRSIAQAFAAKIKQDSVAISEIQAVNTQQTEEINSLHAANRKLYHEILPGITHKMWELSEANNVLRHDVDSLFTLITPVTDRLDALEATVGELPDGCMETLSDIVVRHEDAISDLQNRVEVLEGQMVKIDNLLRHRIQSLVYVPDYNDGKITIDGAVITCTNPEESIRLTDVTSDIVYKVRPAHLADTIVTAWKAETLKARFDAIVVKTREADQHFPVTLEIVGMKANKETGDITVTVDPVDTNIIRDAAYNSVSLVLFDQDGNSRTTEYTGLVNGGDTELEFQVGERKFYNEKVSKDYTQSASTDSVSFFSSKFAQFKIDGGVYGSQSIKSTYGWDVAKYISNELKYDETAGYEDFLEIIDRSTYYRVVLNSDKTETVKHVGDTAFFFKKIALVNGDERLDSVMFKGHFAVTPIKPYADLSATLKWNLAENCRGDIYTNACGNVVRAFQFNGPNKGVAAKLDSSNVQSKSGFGPSVFSHLEPLANSIVVVKVKQDDQKDTLKNTEFDKFKISNIVMAGTEAKPEFKFDIQGFDFTAKQYIVSAKYLPVYEGQVSMDTTKVRLFINVEDRDRDMIVEHTYPTQTIDVTKDFGGKVRIHLQKEGAEWEYFSALLDSLDQPDTLKFANFTNKVTVQSPAKTLAYALVDENEPKGYNTSKLDLICNDADSITFDVKYTAADIVSTYATGFSIKDTITLGGGQKVAIEIPFALNWPEYNFKRNQYYVNIDGNNKFYSEVEPFYGHLGVSKGRNATVIDSFDVYKVNLKQCFPTLFKKGVVDPINPTDDGLSITFAFATNPISSTITIEQDTLLNYHGADPYAYVKPVVVLQRVDAATGDTLKTNFEVAPFGENENYNGYYVKRFEPFKLFSQKAQSTTIVNEPKVYEVNVRELMSLTDARGKECLDATQTSTEPNYWVKGNATNGFALGKNAGKIYKITSTQLTLAPDQTIDPVIASRINLNSDTGMLTFDNRGELTLQKDVVVTINAKIVSEWGTYEVKQADRTPGLKIVFKAPAR